MGVGVVVALLLVFSRSISAKADPQVPQMGKLGVEAQQTRVVSVPEKLVAHLMTPEHRQMLTEESGADVEWAPDQGKVRLQGFAKQLGVAARLLARVEMHCHWGSSEEKVRRLLRRRQVNSVLCRLSPMTVNRLMPVERMFTSQSSKMSIGKDKHNHVVVHDPLVSRHHCLVSLDAGKGVVYVTDLSTNGTYLNGRRLPSKKLGKVLLSHGDELLLKDPQTDDEFGFICNLKEVSIAKEMKFEPPRRLLSPEEQSTTRGLGSF